MPSSAKLSIVIAVLAVSQLIFAPTSFGQRGGRGGGGWGGGGPGGDGGDGGGGGRGRGRGGDSQSGPGGGSAADMLAQRMSRTEMSLKNIDTNNNGIIDADEAKDPRAKGQLDRIFGRMNKEPHYPMAISEIMSSYEAFIKTQPQGGFGGPPGQGPGGGPGFGQGGGFPPRDGSSPRDGFPQRDGGPQGRDGGFQGRDGGFPGRDRSQQRDPSGGAPANTSGLTSLPGMGFGSTSQPSRSDGGTISPTSFIIPASGIPAARMPAATDAKPVPKKPSRFATGPERLPKGLPQWFLDIDVNGTGQITMAQYTENWTTQKVEKFNRYDLNHDGIITAEEVLKVEKAKADSN